MDAPAESLDFLHISFLGILALQALLTKIALYTCLISLTLLTIWTPANCRDFWHCWFSPMKLLRRSVTTSCSKWSNPKSWGQNLLLKQSKKFKSKSPIKATKFIQKSSINQIVFHCNFSKWVICQKHIIPFKTKLSLLLKKMLVTYQNLSRWRLLPHVCHNHPQWDEGSQGGTFRCPCTARCPSRRCWRLIQTEIAKCVAHKSTPAS